MSGNSYQLRLKVLVGLSTFILLVMLNGIYQFKSLKLAEQNHRILGELNLLEEVSQGFIRRAGNYLENAARDFESYNRDVQIFHKDILADIKHFTELQKNISDNLNSLGLAIPRAVGGIVGQDDDIAELNAAVSMMDESWGTFQEGLDEKLGENKSEPRIEWGAQFIVDNREDLGMYISTMTERYREFLNQQGNYTNTILQLSLGITVMLGIIGLIWFYQKVIKRIGNTVDACVQVANGDFGYKLKIEGNDEITVLSKSFNALSSRSQLVLAMLGELQQAYSNEQALDIICQSAGGYLPIAWAGLLQVDPNQNKLDLLSAIPSTTSAKINHRHIPMDEGFGQEISNAMIEKKPSMLNQLRQHVVANPSEKMLREIVRITSIDSIAAIPITSRRGWEGVLLFGSRGGQYRADQTELLHRLSPLMANSFERIQNGGEQSTIIMNG